MKTQMRNFVLSMSIATIIILVIAGIVFLGRSLILKWIEPSQKELLAVEIEKAKAEQAKAVAEQAKPAEQTKNTAMLVPLNLYVEGSHQLDRFVDPQARTICYVITAYEGVGISCVPIPARPAEQQTTIQKPATPTPPITGSAPPIRPQVTEKK